MSDLNSKSVENHKPKQEISATVVSLKDLTGPPAPGRDETIGDKFRNLYAWLRSEGKREQATDTVSVYHGTAPHPFVQSDETGKPLEGDHYVIIHKAGLRPLDLPPQAPSLLHPRESGLTFKGASAIALTAGALFGGAWLVDNTSPQSSRSPSGKVGKSFPDGLERELKNDSVSKSSDSTQLTFPIFAERENLIIRELPPIHEINLMSKPSAAELRAAKVHLNSDAVFIEYEGQLKSVASLKLEEQRTGHLMLVKLREELAVPALVKFYEEQPNIFEVATWDPRSQKSVTLWFKAPKDKFNFYKDDFKLVEGSISAGVREEFTND